MEAGSPGHGVREKRGAFSRCFCIISLISYASGARSTLNVSPKTLCPCWELPSFGDRTLAWDPRGDDRAPTCSRPARSRQPGHPVPRPGSGPAAAESQVCERPAGTLASSQWVCPGPAVWASGRGAEGGAAHRGVLLVSQLSPLGGWLWYPHSLTPRHGRQPADSTRLLIRGRGSSELRVTLAEPCWMGPRWHARKKCGLVVKSQPRAQRAH